MKTKMTHSLRMEFANAIRGRCAAAATKDKRRILEEFVAATGYHEKSAIRVLNTPLEPKHQQAVQRLIGEVSSLPPYVASHPSRLGVGNIPGEAAGNRIT